MFKKDKSINSGKKVELVLAIQSKGVSVGKKEKWMNSPAVSKDLRNGCNSDLSLNQRGREKNSSYWLELTIKVQILLKEKNLHVAHVKELAWYVRSQVRVTAGADMMFNDLKSAMKARHHWRAPLSTKNVFMD